MPTDNCFREYQPDQLLLLPQDMREWLPDDHLANFVSDIVDELDLSAIMESYDGSAGGQPAYHPRMMMKLLFYAYATGVPGSRRIERNTYDSVPFRVLATGALDFIQVWEDMAYKTASLISPELVRRFMLPAYEEIIATLRAGGVQAILVLSLIHI